MRDGGEEWERERGRGMGRGRGGQERVEGARGWVRWGEGGGGMGRERVRRAARSEPPRGLSPCDRETDTRLGS